MKYEDAPEARIRDLERPLAEAARASEAGANPPPSKWAPPPGPPLPPPGVPMPPPPPSPYGGSFSSPSRGIFPGGQIRWIMLAVFVLGMIVLPIAIFSFTSHQISRGGLTTLLPVPSISPESPTASGTMPPTNVTPPSMPTTSVSTAPAGENITVSGISEARTIACNGGSVSVSGITNNVVITGHCTSVSVSGIQNQITVDAVDTIQASGSGNQVTYHTGSPTIGNSGFDNVVQRG